MTRDEASFILANIDRRVCDDELNDALDMAIKALEQEPCEDCISRLIVQEEISKSIALKENSHQMYKRIQAIPSVTPQPFINKPCVSKGVCREDKIQVLDKIRAEIMQLDYDIESVDYDYNDMSQTEEIYMICREEVLQIIDKYKAESEE